MSRSITIRCDRCATQVECPEQILTADEVEANIGYRTVAAATGLFLDIEDRLPEGWIHRADEQGVHDVCPGCVTSAERFMERLHSLYVDRLLGLNEDEP